MKRPKGPLSENNAEWMDCACWWSWIGKGLRLQPVYVRAANSKPDVPMPVLSMTADKWMPDHVTDLPLLNTLFCSIVISTIGKLGWLHK